MIDPNGAVSMASIVVSAATLYFAANQRIENSDLRKQINAITKEVYVRRKLPQVEEIKEIRQPSSTRTYRLPDARTQQKLIDRRGARHQLAAVKSQPLAEEYDEQYEEEIYEETPSGRQRLR